MFKYVVANFKTHKSAKQVREYFEQLNKFVDNQKSTGHLESVYPMIFLNHLHVLVANEVATKNVMVGAQSGFHMDEGAYTSAVSLKQLNDDGINTVLIGHSEEFLFFHETFESVNKKLLKALEIGLKPVVCFGEQEVQIEFEKTIKHLEKQLDIILQGVKPEDFNKIVLAYEPRWAIGKTQSLGQEKAGEIILAVKKYVERNFKCSVDVLYGGSVKVDTIEGFIRQDSIDGVLIGKEALDVEKYIDMLKITDQVLAEIKNEK